MPDGTENQNTNNQPNGGNQTQAAANGAADGGSSGGAPANQPGSDGAPATKGRNVVMSAGAFEETIRKKVEQGKRAATRDLEEKAKAAGFASLDAMFAHQGGRGGGGGGGGGKGNSNGTRASGGDGDEGNPPNRPSPPANKHDRKAMAKYERQMGRYQKQLGEMSKKARTEERRRKDVQRSKDALEARIALERVAIQKGIKDPEYAIHLYTKHIEGKTDEELAKLDESAFFDGLRTSHAYLFGETTVPATTGTGGNNPPAPPKPGNAAANAAANGQVDAMKMDRKQYEEHLKKRNINPHALQ